MAASVKFVAGKPVTSAEVSNLSAKLVLLTREPVEFAFTGCKFGQKFLHDRGYRCILLGGFHSRASIGVIIQ